MSSCTYAQSCRAGLTASTVGSQSLRAVGKSPREVCSAPPPRTMLRPLLHNAIPRRRRVYPTTHHEATYASHVREPSEAVKHKSAAAVSIGELRALRVNNQGAHTTLARTRAAVHRGWRCVRVPPACVRRRRWRRVGPGDCDRGGAPIAPCSRGASRSMPNRQPPSWGVARGLRQIPFARVGAAVPQLQGRGAT
jgi:hypothetical protein